jgi:hypothetical protein
MMPYVQTCRPQRTNAVMGVEVPGDVHIAAREAVDPLFLPEDGETNLVNGPGLCPMIGVAHEQDLATSLVAGQSIGARADRLAREEVPALVFEHAFRVDSQRKILQSAQLAEDSAPETRLGRPWAPLAPRTWVAWHALARPSQCDRA